VVEWARSKHQQETTKGTEQAEYRKSGSWGVLHFLYIFVPLRFAADLRAHYLHFGSKSRGPREVSRRNKPMESYGLRRGGKLKCRRLFVFDLPPVLCLCALKKSAFWQKLNGEVASRRAMKRAQHDPGNRRRHLGRWSLAAHARSASFAMRSSRGARWLH
jgi:hypothetical protein